MKSEMVRVMIVVSAFALVVSGVGAAATVYAMPTCTDINSDPDGDGWGWENNSSCRVGGSGNNNNGGGGTPTCTDINSDPDGDGWGWEGGVSCQVDGNGKQKTCVDSDGDGWGWDGVASCKVGDNTDTSGPGNGSAILNGITDVVLVAGQSNAVNENTLSDRNLDAPSDNIVIWLPGEKRWAKADLCSQVWYKNVKTPFRSWENFCSNNIAFQIAKKIVERDPSRKVALIATGDPGKSISHWDEYGYNQIQIQTEEALSKLPVGSRDVDMIAWLQGEADHGKSDWYSGKLANLIDRFQSENWFTDGYFLASTTAHQPYRSVNDVIRELCTDTESRTGCVEGEDLEKKDVAHFSGPALRILGERYADKYLE